MLSYLSDVDFGMNLYAKFIEYIFLYCLTKVNDILALCSAAINKDKSLLVVYTGSAK